MAFSRYSFSILSNDGKTIEPSKASYKIHQAATLGLIQTTIRVIEEGERLDQLAVVCMVIASYGGLFLPLVVLDGHYKSHQGLG